MLRHCSEALHGIPIRTPQKIKIPMNPSVESRIRNDPSVFGTSHPAFFSPNAGSPSGGVGHCTSNATRYGCIRGRLSRSCFWVRVMVPCDFTVPIFSISGRGSAATYDTRAVHISLPGRAVKRCSGSLQFQQNPAGDCEVAHGASFHWFFFPGDHSIQKRSQRCPLDILDSSGTARCASSFAQDAE